MAEIELNLKGDAEVKLRGVDKAFAALGEGAASVGNAADRALMRIAQGAANVGNALREQLKQAVKVSAEGLKEAATAVTQAMLALGRATVAGAVANEQQQRALRALGPAYQEITRATNGTVTATEAWRVQQQLLQSGLPTTGRELALITRAARDYATATGTETPAAIEQLTQALINGEAGGLRRFGLSVANGATRTETFNSALQQLQRTQSSTVPASRSLAEEVSHFGSTVTEAGGALAGFLAQAGDVQTTMRLVGDSVRDAAGEFAELVALNNRTRTTTGAVRGRIQGAGGPARASNRPTAEQQRMIDEGNAAGQTAAARALQNAEEHANRPASGGGGPDTSEATRRANVWMVERERIETTRKARAAAEVEYVRMIVERVAAETAATDAEKNLAASRAQFERDAVDIERRGRLELLGLARDRRDAELALADAEDRGDDARRDRAAELTSLRDALRGMLAETNARIEVATAEHRGAEEMNALLRERIGIQQSLTQTTTQLTEVQRANGAALREFRDAMVQQAAGVAEAFGAAAAAALDGQQSFAAALGAALREQMKALTKEAVVMSLKNLAMGTAALFTNPAAAPGFFAAAGLWGAVGVAAGGITAATAPSKPATPSSVGSDRAASASAAKAPSESSGPLTIQINVSGAMFNEGVEENVVRALNGADARGLLPRRLRG